MRTLRSSLAVIAMCAAALLGLPASAQSSVAWQQWEHEVGIVDVGARSDGSLVAMIAGHIFTLSPTTGALTPFAPGFSADPNAESYFVVASDLTSSNPQCSWRADDMYVLDLSSPPGIARVDPSGGVSRFATLNGVDTLGGITLDRTGRFDHALLVTGTHNANQTTLFAIGCDGSTAVLTDSAPQVEGGIAVAPDSFGNFGGDLIAPDENSGQIWAIDPTGAASLVVLSGLPFGGDTGVESEGFVPTGFTASSSGFAYLSDRGTPDNPFPGTDSLLRLSAAALASAGVQDGDLLVATEGNGTTIAVRCGQTCSVIQAAQGTPGGHIEGKIAFSQ